MDRFPVPDPFSISSSMENGGKLVKACGFPNHSMQRMRASRSDHFQVEHRRRLALTADAGR
jgi:hypothetical protein